MRDLTPQVGYHATTHTPWNREWSNQLVKVLEMRVLPGSTKRIYEVEMPSGSILHFFEWELIRDYRARAVDRN
jgi:hypothetical protein